MDAEIDFSEDKILMFRLIGGQLCPDLMEQDLTAQVHLEEDLDPVAAVMPVGVMEEVWGAEPDLAGDSPRRPTVWKPKHPSLSSAKPGLRASWQLSMSR